MHSLHPVLLVVFLALLGYCPETGWGGRYSMPRHTMLLVTIAMTMHGMRIIAPTMHCRYTRHVSFVTARLQPSSFTIWHGMHDSDAIQLHSTAAMADAPMPASNP